MFEKFGAYDTVFRAPRQEDLINKIKSTSNTVGFANDGDGDRYGVINENGDYVTPNEIMAILLMHLKKNKNVYIAYFLTCSVIDLVFSITLSIVIIARAESFPLGSPNELVAVPIRIIGCTPND